MGEGSDHNVSNSDGDFESETVGEEGHPVEHTFGESGTDTHVCTPHEAVGMKAVIRVEWHSLRPEDGVLAVDVL